jgi:ribosome production factor 2
MVENCKTTLILKGEKTSQIVQLVLGDLHQLKSPHTKRFSKKNAIRPFEDTTSLEFFAQKNDASLMMLGHHSKKRPHAITMVRLFDYKVLDMLELMVDDESFRSMAQFKTARKPAIGLKPLVAFSGTLFDSPTPNAYTLAKSLFADMFRGRDVASVDVEALQWMVHFVVEEEEEEGQGAPPPKIRMRCYRLLTKRSGQKLPRVEVEEIGPRIDFRVGRKQEAEEAMMRAALTKPKQLQERTRKNIQTDAMGDKIGKIHVGKQDLSTLQTRKMKGLKRHLDVADADGDDTVETEMRNLKVVKVG